MVQMDLFTNSKGKFKRIRENYRRAQNYVINAKSDYLASVTCKYRNSCTF